MSKAKNPLMSFLAQGRLGKLLSFKRSRSQNIVETSPAPPDAKSLAQLSWRHMYLKAVALWHALSTAEQQDWESQARRRHMTGFAWFISQALKPNPGLYLPLQGGTMAGNILMASNKLRDLPAPVLPNDAARLIDLIGVNNFLALTDTPAAYAGQALKGVRVNAGANALEFAALVGGYTEGARAYHDASISIPNTTWTVLPLNSERYDTDSIHNLVIANQRLTCKTPGKYDISATVFFDTNNVGDRRLEIIYNNITPIAGIGLKAITAGYTGCAFSTVYNLALNDYLHVRVYQSSGGALNVISASAYSPEFAMQRIG